MPIVFINCLVFDFIFAIMTGKKLYETRTRNTLKQLVGKRVFLCKTGKGKKLVMCSAIIESITIVDNVKSWKQYRKACCIATGSKYDYIPGTKKYLYRLTDVKPVKAFVPAEGKRHGYVWMEYNGKAEEI
jgi:predicted transcriptional regulator